MRQFLPRAAKNKKKTITEINVKKKKEITQRDKVEKNKNKSKGDKEKKEGKMTQNSFKTETLLNLLANFDGKKITDIEKHVLEFEKIVTATKIPDEFKSLFLKSKFCGYAKEVITEDADLQAETDYAKLKEKLIKRFEKKLIIEEQQANFAAVKQKTTESIEDYLHRFNVIANKYLNASGLSQKEGAIEFFEKMKIGKFLDTIKTDIAYEVRKEAYSKFEEVVKRAKQIELAKINSDKIEDVNAIATGSATEEMCKLMLNLSTQQQDSIKKLTEEVNFLKNKEGTGNDKSETKYCHICNISSHFTSQCYYNGKNTTQSFRGGRPGYKQQNNYTNRNFGNTYNHRGRNFDNYRGNRGNYYGNRQHNYNSKFDDKNLKNPNAGNGKGDC